MNMSQSDSGPVCMYPDYRTVAIKGSQQADNYVEMKAVWNLQERTPWRGLEWFNKPVTGKALVEFRVGLRSKELKKKKGE